MSEDKRKVHTDALETLGMIIDETAKRDAIHLAVEPVIAKEDLYPGQHVSVDGYRCYEGDIEAVGIVDPFLDKLVNPGERFWLVLYPRQITSLRHVWEHPKFLPSEIQISEEKEELNLEIEKSKKWIKNYINRLHKRTVDYYYGDELTYETLMSHADYWVTTNDTRRKVFYTGDVDEYLEDKFWHHYEIVRGKKVEEDKKTSFFTCAC